MPGSPTWLGAKYSDLTHDPDERLTGKLLKNQKKTRQM